MAKKDFWDIIQKINPKIIYVIILLSASFVIIKPIGLPVPIGQPVRGLYNFIEELPAESYIIWDLGIGANVYAELSPASAAVMNHILKRPLKVVLVTFSADAVPLINLMIETLVKIPSDKKYGVDYVFMGYLAGGETAKAALATNFRGTLPKDYLGTPIDNIPMLNNVKGADNFKLIIDTSASLDTPYHWIRQWFTLYGVPFAKVGSAGDIPSLLNLYPAQMFAYLMGARGGAEYELLISMPGRNLQMTDAISMTHIWIIIFLALGNIGYLMGRLQKKTVQEEHKI